MEKCPHCGGTSGYSSDFWVQYHQISDWSGEGISSDDSTGKGGAIGTCLDCGKRFNIAKMLEKKEKENG